jgi:hypothetical protein
VEIVAEAVERRAVVGYLRGLLDDARRVPDGPLLVRRLLAGRLRVKARFTDLALGALYTRRLAPDPLPVDPADLHVDAFEPTPLGWPEPAEWADTTYDDGLFEAQLERAGLRAVYPYQAGLWLAYDPATGRALQLARDRRSLPVWDSGAPLRLPIHWAALEKGHRLVHAAVVGEGEKGILLAGPGGAGKSGTTLAAIAGGLNTVGDDYVMIELAQPPVAWPVYRLIKQDLAGIDRFPELRERLAGIVLNWQGKVELDPEEWFPGSMVPRMELRAVAIPTIVGGAVTRLEPLPRGKAIEIVTRNTISQLPGDKRAAVSFFTALATRMPAYRLLLSEDPVEIAATLREFVGGLP